MIYLRFCVIQDARENLAAVEVEVEDSEVTAFLQSSLLSSSFF